MNRQKIDFLFRYEHKVRELESIMLLKLELERRGYTVAFVGNYDYKQIDNYYPKVFISPAIYNNNNLYGEFIKYGLIRKIANLQWEQVFTISNEKDINFAQNITGIGTKTINFCWGIRSKERIIKGGVNKECAIVVGQVNADLLKDKFSQSLKRKEELAKDFNINSNLKWHLFISSFAYCELDKLQTELIIKAIGYKDYYRFKKISDESRESILDWFESMLKQDKETILIYRPHPDEAKKSTRLKDMEHRFPNFKVIPDLAIKHWINACDKIYNWYSTGIIDGIILNKPWRLLRPITIDEDLDYRMMHHAQSIKSYKEYIEDVQNYEIKDIIEKNILDSYYYIPDNYSYIKVCDILEEMLLTTKYDIHYTFNEYIHLNILLTKNKIKTILKKIIENTLSDKLIKIIFKTKLEKQRIRKQILIDGYEKNVINEKDINDITERLKPIVYGE